MNRFASIAVGVAVVGCLAACEYSPGDGSGADGSPAEGSSEWPPGGATASDNSNRDALMEILGAPDSGGLPYQTGPTATLSADIAPGQYLLTAGCVGASGADVSVTFGDSPPEKYSFSCGMGKVIQIDHPNGKMLAEVVPQEPRAGAVTGLKLEHHAAPRDTAARNQDWMTEHLGPEKPDEFRRFLSSGESMATGPLAAGPYEIAFICSGPDSVDLTALSASGEPIDEWPNVPCGPVFRTNLQLGAEGAYILVDSGTGTMRAAVSVLTGAAGGS